jgi:stage V sporulation protein D (sporulation-specific penicillin-binding protein)
MNKVKKGFLIRIRVLSAFAILVGLFLIARLFHIQYLNKEYYASKGDDSYVASADSFDRGTIYFEKKDETRISAASVMSGFSIVLRPNQILDKEMTYEKINSVYPIDKEVFMSNAEREKSTYREVFKKVPKDARDKIVELNLPGIEVPARKWRFYPGESLAAHTLGFMAYQGDEITGRYGIERFYNEALSRGKEDVQINIFAELFSNFYNSDISEESDKKADLVVTLEPVVQNFVEQELFRTMKKFGSEAANGIIINPQNGEILAMVHLPDFDLNNFGDVGDASEYSNPLVENVFEFGSVVKPLVIAAALDAGVISAETPFYDPGFVQVEDKKIENFDKKGRGQTTMQTVLSESLNTGMVYSMRQLGRGRFRDYMLSYGIGEKSGVDLPNEARGLVSNLESPRELEYATASFGQGISFSPVVLVRALSAMANGGYIIQPHIVKKFEYTDGKTKEVVYEKTEGKRILKEGTSEKISQMLVSSVDNTLGGGKYKMPGHSIAAKTGTAQIPNPRGGGYIEGKNMHSFVGYFPAYDPKFLIFISNTAPVGARFASETLTEPFINIAHFLINYYEVPPDR